MSSSSEQWGRFELYSIIFDSLDSNRQKDLKTIAFDAPDGIEVIYERDDDVNIPIKEPLSLIGPSQTTLPYDPLYIVFGELGKSMWRWGLHYDEVDGDDINIPIQQYVYDNDSSSCAIICYDILSRGVDASLNFRYEDKDKGRALRITNGEIYATTAKNSCTKRVLRSFGRSERSIRKKKTRWIRNGNEEEVVPHELIKLDRSELGLPVDMVLDVTVNLKFRFVPLECEISDLEELPAGEICQTHTFTAPRSVVSPTEKFLVEFDLNAGRVRGPKLLLAVSWSDDLQSRKSDELSRVLAEYRSKYSLTEVEVERERSSRNNAELSEVLAKYNNEIGRHIQLNSNELSEVLAKYNKEIALHIQNLGEKLLHPMKSVLEDDVGSDSWLQFVDDSLKSEEVSDSVVLEDDVGWLKFEDDTLKSEDDSFIESTPKGRCEIRGEMCGWDWESPMVPMVSI
ncbi:hypothetical protein ACHQM5_005048 [Ranunculus cassubicifolius]